MLNHKERRNFPRIQCRAIGELETAGGRWPVQLVDLSFTGALVVSATAIPPNLSEPVTLYINLSPGQNIKMRGRLIHASGTYLGLECSPTGLDQRAQLRSLFNKHN